MAVIINDFELISEQPSATPPAGAASPAPAKPPASAPRPDDIAAVLHQRVQRALRLRAH